MRVCVNDVGDLVSAALDRVEADGTQVRERQIIVCFEKHADGAPEGGIWAVLVDC
jgi:hypothetical protein